MVLGKVAAGVGIKKAIDFATKEPKSAEQLKCESKGGKWNSETKTCTLPEALQPTEAPPVTVPDKGTKPGRFRPFKDEFTTEDGQSFPTINPDFRPTANPDQSVTFNEDGTVNVTRGGTSQTLSPEEYDVLLGKPGAVTNKVLAIQNASSRGGLEDQALIDQIGQTAPSSTEPTPGLIPGVDLGESLTQSVVGAVPRALTLAGIAASSGAAIGAGVGLAGGPAAPVTVPVGATAGAVIGGVLTFAGSLGASIKSNIEEQRGDDINSQLRVLTDGKQNMQDSATRAADPTQKQDAVESFNAMKQRIQNAHIKVLADQDADILDFDTATNAIGEFNVFYGPGGELEQLEADMALSLAGGQDPAVIEYRMIELATRKSTEGSLKNIPDPSFFDELIP